LVNRSREVGFHYILEDLNRISCLEVFGTGLYFSVAFNPTYENWGSGVLGKKGEVTNLAYLF
jgi:hypothetical protein